MPNNLPEHFSTMNPTLPTVRRQYEIRAPVFHLPIITPQIYQTFYSVLPYRFIKQGYTFFMYYMIMERVDTAPNPSYKFYMN